MTLTYVPQDLLRVTARMGVIAHQVNTVGAVGGLNKALCDKFPGNRDVLKQAHEAGTAPLGTLLLYDCGTTVIANMVAQVFPGAPEVLPVDSYEARRKALVHCFEQLLEQTDSDIYVPYMLSCGLAGDNWARAIEPILQHVAQFRNVWVCVPNWAEEKAMAKGYLPRPQQAAAA